MKVVYQPSPRGCHVCEVAAHIDQYRGIPWNQLPCARCKFGQDDSHVFRPRTECTLHPGFDTPNDNTWQERSEARDETHREAYVLIRFATAMKDAPKEVAALFMSFAEDGGRQVSLTTLSRCITILCNKRISKQGVAKLRDKAIRRWPELGRLFHRYQDKETNE